MEDQLTTNRNSPTKAKKTGVEAPAAAKPAPKETQPKKQKKAATTAAPANESIKLLPVKV